MMPDWKFDVLCSCGAANRVVGAKAGSTVECSQCGRELSVPGLTKLKQLNTVDDSPLGRIQQSIKSRNPPFSGSCQTCDAYQGTKVLVACIEVRNGEAGDSRSVAIPCFFCDMCAKDFRSGLWSGQLKSFGHAMLNTTWLLLALVASSVIALLLPLLGVVFVLAILSGVIYRLTRRKANPYLLTHLNKICNLNDALKGIDEYTLTSGSMRSLPANLSSPKSR